LPDSFARYFCQIFLPDIFAGILRDDFVVDFIIFFKNLKL
jgi:hypothetical protein